MKIGLSKQTKYVPQIVDIHMKTFPGFFLTFLGKGFLNTLYTGFMEHPHSGIILAINNSNQILGFCAFSENLSDFYKYLLKNHLLKFAWYALGGFIRSPKVLFRLLRAFTYPKESTREEPYVELSSIGVLPDSKNLGIGSKMIKRLIDLYRGKDISYIKLETDKDNNEAANTFYLKNGFILDHSYETPEKRRMNEYHYYL